MSIIKVASKKAKNGYTYKVTFKYKEFGVTRSYSKSGFSTKKAAKEHENVIKAEIKENGCIRKQCTKTLNEVFEEFLEVGSDKYQPNTIYNTRKNYKKVKNVLGNTPIVKINYVMLQKYFNSISDQGIETNKSIKKALNRIFIHALKMEYIKSNPLTLVDVKGIENKMDHTEILSSEDFYRLIQTLKDTDNFLYYAYAIAVEIGYYTGLRISEVFALDKSDIDFDNDMISINKKLIYTGLKKDELYATHQMKSKSSNAIIPLAAPLKQSLIEWFNINPHDHVICDADGYFLNPINSSTKIKNISKSIAIEFHFHMLRHTYVTNLAKSNIDIKTLQELARHSNVNTTMSVYTHIQEEQKKKAINNVFTNIYSKNTLKIN